MYIHLLSHESAKAGQVIECSWTDVLFKAENVYFLPLNLDALPVTPSTV